MDDNNEGSTADHLIEIEIATEFNSIFGDEEESFEEIKVQHVEEIKNQQQEKMIIKSNHHHKYSDRNIFVKMTIFTVLMIALCLIATYLIYKRLQHPYEHPVLIARRRSEMPS